LITLSSIDELNETKKAVEQLKKEFPNLFKRLSDLVNLTRAFRFEYQYLGCLITEEDSTEYVPKFVHESVLRLYKRELQKLKADVDFPVVKQTYNEFRRIGFSKISLLVLGMNPESLVGASSIK
jgi:hypothetical protein